MIAPSCACVRVCVAAHAPTRDEKCLGGDKEKWEKQTRGEEEAREQSNKSEKQKEVNWE